MVVGGIMGHAMNRLYYSEEKKLREKQMVQRLRNSTLIPSALPPPPSSPFPFKHTLRA